MSQTSLTDTIAALFTAPAEAAILAERRFRQIWTAWLRDAQGRIEAAPATAKAQLLSQLLDLAPVMTFEAAIDLGVTMRLVSVRRRSGGGELGLAVGPFQAAGTFGFMGETTTESVLQARARYQLSNRNTLTLRDYLQGATGGLPTPETLADTIDLLERTQAAAPGSRVRPAPRGAAG